MRRFLIGSLGVVLLVWRAEAGDFTASYYAGTPEGSWSMYNQTTKDGTQATYTYTRKPDVDGRVVLELHVTTTAGVAAGSESTMTYTMPEGFDLAKDGMSYGKFIDKMTMTYGDMEMPVDENTLQIIRDAEKDYRGNVTFVGTDMAEGLECNKYTYEIAGDSTKDTGTLWLNESLPFAVVRHEGRVVGNDGVVAAEFAMVLADRGWADEPVAEPEPEPQPEPIVTTLVDGFPAGYIGLDVRAVDGGRSLLVNFRNEHAAQLTIQLAAGPVDLAVGFPAETLRLQIPGATNLVLEAGDASEPILLRQRGTRGIAEGKSYMSVYEGTPVFQGSVTMDELPK